MESKNYKICFICLIFCILYNPVMGQKTNIYQQQIDSIIKRQALNSNDSVRIVDMSNLTNYYFLQYDFTKGFSSLNQLKRMTYKPSPRLTDLYYYNSLKYFLGNYETYFLDNYIENVNEIADKIGKPFSIKASESPKVNEDFVRNQLYNALKSAEIITENYNKALIFSLLAHSFMRTKTIDSVAYYGNIAVDIFDKIGKKDEAFCPIASKILFYNEFIFKDSLTNQAKDSLKIEETKAINYVSSTSNLKTKATMYYFLGHIYNVLRRYTSSIQCLSKSNEIWEELGNRNKQVKVLFDLANYSNLLENYDSDRAYLLKAYEIKKQTGDTSDLYEYYFLMVFNSIQLKKLEEADNYALLARNSIGSTKDVFQIARVFDAEGQVLYAKGKYQEAIDKFLIVAEGFKKANALGYLTYPYLYLGQCYDSLNQLNNGIKYATLCYELCISFNFDVNTISSSDLLADLYAKKGDLTKAYQYLSIHNKVKKEYDAKNQSARASDFEAQNIINRNQKKIDLLQKDNELIASRNKTQTLGIISAICALFGAGYFIFFLKRTNTQKQKDNQLLEQQRDKINAQKEILETTLADLKSTQTQLIQKEKLASLGELTAGIAHEIQNPLNFVNNFSELSVDLAKDLKEEIHKPNIDKEYVEELLTDLSQNQEKINHHGKRASSIVKGMLEHSRASTGVKEMTDINALADEYFRLSYHGLRAKDKDFNATMETNFDKNLPKINLIPQDMGRVLLNLFNNAFYAVNQRSQQLDASFELASSYTPSVFLTTQLIDNQIVIKVKDNGMGMPESVRAKVFQPFFTTKPTGSGTGLGLSLAYDIVTKGHGGALEVESNEGKETIFLINLPIN
jgi:two-component system, NtrC family, sensor kinase